MDIRKAYYSSLGVKVLESKKSVEQALQDTILVKDKLSFICKWVRIPHVYRNVVWKVLLGINLLIGDVMPLNKRAWDMSIKERRTQFELLKEAVSILTFNPKLLKTELSGKTMAQMLLIELSSDPFSTNLALENPPQHLISMATAILNIYDDFDEEDSFWILVGFVNSFKISTAVDPPVPAMNISLLKDIPDLLSHIISLNVDLDKITKQWFQSMFSTIISYQSIESLWDIIIGGGKSIIFHTAAAIFKTSSKRLIQTRTPEEFYEECNKLEKRIDSNQVVQMAIEKWESPELENLPRDQRFVSIN
ncbi:hypothetical protein HDV06_002843 [Boothiomyces sp. JEL0866]|nr:hypothetical protein HDV06_002843 [Boothiomyces sp. JEL0866]